MAKNEKRKKPKNKQTTQKPFNECINKHTITIYDKDYMRELDMLGEFMEVLDSNKNQILINQKRMEKQLLKIARELGVDI